MDIALGNVPSSVLDNTDNVIFTEGELAKKVQYSDMKTDIVGSANLSTAAQTPKEAINELNQDLLDSVGYGVISGGVVSAQSTPNMTVQVTSCTYKTSTGARKTATANSSLAVATADTTNPRTDIVYINSSGVISYLQGTAAVSPVTPTTPTGGFLLAQINVSANATSVTNSNIADMRKILISTDYLNAQLSDKAKQTDLNTTNANLAQLSNPNLLINGDFQVWQRGTSFTGKSQIDMRYVADRVYCFTGDDTCTISKVDNGMKIVGACLMYYRFEDEEYKKIAGKTVTFSYSKNGVITKNTFVAPATQNINYTCITCNVGETNIINWRKLELGSIATPFIPRLYAEELALCQRYYEKGYTIFNCLIPNWIVGSLQLVPKRVAPTLNVYSSKKNLGKVGNFITGNETSGTLTFRMTDDSENNGGCSYNGLHAIMSSINDFTSGNAYSFYWVADSEIY